MGKSSGGGGSSALQTIATINAINAANAASSQMAANPAPSPSAPPTVAPYTQSQAAIEATRNKFAEGLKGQEADILGGNKKKNKLAAGAQAGDATAPATDVAAQTTDTYGSTKLGA